VQEKEPESAVKQPVSTGAEALSAAKVAPVPPLVGDFITIDHPVHLELVHVPAGDFLVGDSEGGRDVHPQHRLYVPEFYIGKYPITNAQYAVFVKATGYHRSDEWEKEEIPASEDGHPVVGISWHDATAFCRWLASATGLAFRLPTEAQWEKAASWDAHKQQKYRYPWGDEFDVEKCNTNESGIGNTTPVGKYSPVGDSVYGAADMAGNVSEWCSSLHRSYPYRAEDGREDLTASGERVLRGGSWYDGQNFAAASFRDHNPPDGRSNLFGVRVVVSGSPV
jgi:formylglycine-generating enzyme required for sulfatase activity